MTDVRFTRVLPGRRLVGQGAGKNAEATLPHPPWRLRGDVCFVTIHGLAAAERNDIQPFKIACGNGLDAPIDTVTLLDGCHAARRTAP